MRLIAFIVLLTFFAGCQSAENAEAESSTFEDPAAALARQGMTKSEVATDLKEVPRTAGCTFIADEKILEIIAGDDVANTTISNQPGPTVSACLYRLENRRWSADLSVELTDSGRSDILIKQVEAASPAEKATVHGKVAQWLSDNRILRVIAGPPYELKLSILPKPDHPEYADAAARKQMLEALAKAINER